MAMPTIQSAQAKYAQNGGAAGQYWQEGAQRFEGDPTQLAAAAINSGKAAQNYSAAVPRMVRQLAAVGKGGWLAGIAAPSAVTAYTNGVQGKGQEKWGKAMGTWFPIFQGLSQQISQMPKNTPQDSINRVAAWINGTIQAKQNL